MAYHRNTCVQCGKVYYPRNSNPRNKFCSDACSQKAYRKRRKTQKESEQHMIPFAAYEIQQIVLDRYPQAKDHLMRFVSVHGKDSYVELLNVLGVVLPIAGEIS